MSILSVVVGQPPPPRLVVDQGVVQIELEPHLGATVGIVLRESPAEWLRTSAARMLAVADELEPLVPVVTEGCAS